MPRIAVESKATDRSLVEAGTEPETSLPVFASGDDAQRLLIIAPLPGYVRIALPWQPECPQAHITSVWPLRPSQCGLQNFESLAAAQLQAGFAHFFASDMNISFADSPRLRPKAARSEMPGSEHAQVGVDPFFTRSKARRSANPRWLIATRWRCPCRIFHSECEDMKNDGVSHCFYW
jgi:hypothetical protein